MQKRSNRRGEPADGGYGLRTTTGEIADTTADVTMAAPPFWMGAHMMGEALLRARAPGPLPPDADALATVVGECAEAWGYQDVPGPNMTDLADFVGNGCPPDALLEAERRSRENLRTVWLESLAGQGDGQTKSPATELDGQFDTLPPPDNPDLTWPIYALHGTGPGLTTPGTVAYQCQLWETAGERAGLHPLTPLIKAWYDRFSPVNPEKKRFGIVPRAAYEGLVPAMSRPATPKKEASLPPLPVGGFTPESMAYLPGLAPPTRPDIAPPLAMFDATGIQSLAQGRGAPLGLRLWLETLMCAPVGYRTKTRFHLSLREVVEWLWPHDRYPRLKPDRRDALAAAFKLIDQARLPWEGECMGRWGSGWWRPVSVVGLPSVDLESSVILDVELPPGSGNGPLVDRAMLRIFGLDSAPAYRAYLNLAYLWDRRGTYHGRRITATRPTVRRNGAGNIVDGKGRVIANRDGSPSTNWAHRRAVRTGEDETNPAAERSGLLRVYTPDDLVTLCFPQGVGPGNPREYRRRAQKVLERMANAGAVILEPSINRDGAKGLRILPPTGFGLPSQNSEG